MTCFYSLSCMCLTFTPVSECICIGKFRCPMPSSTIHIRLLRTIATVYSISSLCDLDTVSLMTSEMTLKWDARHYQYEFSWLIHLFFFVSMSDAKYTLRFGIHSSSTFFWITLDHCLAGELKVFALCRRCKRVLQDSWTMFRLAAHYSIKTSNNRTFY